LFTIGTMPDQPVQRILFFFSALSAPYILGTLLAKYSPT
jgi:hypothetical protein